MDEEIVLTEQAFDSQVKKRKANKNCRGKPKTGRESIPLCLSTHRLFVDFCDYLVEETVFLYGT